MKNTIEHKGHTFEVVNSIPAGYHVWNIGTNMIDGYLPLCEPIDSDMYTVNVDTLKAIKIDEAQTILAACKYSKEISTPEGMERYIKRYNNAKGASARRKVALMKKALPIFKTIVFE